MNKICARCKIEKSVDCFHRQRNILQSYCKDCKLAYNRKFKAGRKYYLYNAKFKYKLSEQDVIALENKYNGICPICERSKKLVIDHSHETGKVRGLICYDCNRILTILDDKYKLTNAIKYLNESSSSS